MFQIRQAIPTDAPGILKIYAFYIESTSLTFETEVPSVESFADRIASYLETWPWLVFENNGEIGGYAYASKHRERAGYKWCAESSVYILDKYKGSGVAKALYQTLFAILKKQGCRNVYAVINLPNETSVSFHEKCGFKYFATFENIGYKLGSWKNVGWWRVILNGFDDNPAPPEKFSVMNKGFLPVLFADTAKHIRIVSTNK